MTLLELKMRAKAKEEDEKAKAARKRNILVLILDYFAKNGSDARTRDTRGGPHIGARRASLRWLADMLVLCSSRVTATWTRWIVCRLSLR